MNNLPVELMLRIVSFVEKPTFIHNNDNLQYRKTISQLSKISKRWNQATSHLLWETAIVYRENLLSFITSLLYSVKYDLALNSPDHPLQKLVDLHMESLIQFYSPKKEAIPVEEVQDVVQPSNLEFEDFRLEFARRLREALNEVANTQSTPSQSNPLKYGKGVYVQMILIPSYDPLMEALELIFPWIPNCTSIKFRHPTHGPDFIPTLQPKIIEYASTIFPNLAHLSIDDVDVEGWPTLVETMFQYGQNLKSVCIEACSETEPYTSKRGLATVFPALKQLECLRLDGVPIASDSLAWSGDLDLLVLSNTCQQLRAVTIDFCDITIQSLHTLWDNCHNLEFLGLAGIQSFLPTQNPFRLKPKMKTLRFVDCQIDDDLLSAACQAAPNLQMLRIVFEYPLSFDIWSPHTALTDRSLFAVAKFCPNLKVLALSRTSGMSHEGINEVLKSTTLKTLDFHRTNAQAGVVGSLSDEFVMSIIPHMAKIRTLNLFEQPAIESETILKAIGQNPNLRSLCLNGCEIDSRFLLDYANTPNNIQYLSLFDCKNVSDDDVQTFAQNLEKKAYNMKILYTSTTIEDKFFVSNRDEWFIHEKLDIFSLWDSVVKNRLVF